MPSAKKEVKAEEPLFVDEEGSYVHEAEQARYRGGVRRHAQAGGADGAAAASATGRSPSPASSGKGAPASGATAAANAASSTTGGGGGAAAMAASSTSPGVTSGSAPTAGAAAAGGGGGGGGSGDGAVLFRHGHGVYTCPSFTYDGGWEEDAMHGTGTLTFTQSGNSYSGSLAHGCFSGLGTYTWRSGAVYVGQWRANRMHGDGVYTDAQGHMWRGRYYNGTGPGLIRLYPTLEPAQGVAAHEIASPATTTVNGGGGGSAGLSTTA